MIISSFWRVVFYIRNIILLGCYSNGGFHITEYLLLGVATNKGYSVWGSMLETSNLGKLPNGLEF